MSEAPRGREGTSDPPPSDDSSAGGSRPSAEEPRPPAAPKPAPQTLPARRRRLWILLVLVLVLAVPFWKLYRSPLRSDERVVLFTAAAQLSGDGRSWQVPVHGWAFEPEEDSSLRAAAVAALRNALGVDEQSLDNAVLTRRLHWFLVDNERSKAVRIRIAGAELAAGPSDPGGHFTATMLVPVEAAKEHLRDGALMIEALSPAHPGGSFLGTAQLVGPEGVSVVSDIDDTIKVTEVRDKKAVLRNTFLREFEAAPGMAELYRRWAAAGVSFHYVSSSPWQLYPELVSFMQRERFPPATLSLKRFRLKDSSVLDLFADPLETKPPAIEALLEAFPKRRFCLVGDSGEKDPEVYGEVARRHPDRIGCIYIRNVTGEKRDDPRFVQAMRELGSLRWELFDDPSSLVLPTE
jgi:phosphatidate phosphatase APP1